MEGRGVRDGAGFGVVMADCVCAEGVSVTAGADEHEESNARRHAI